MQFTPADMWAHTGTFAKLIVIVMGVMSLASLLVAAERIVVFALSNRDSKRFARDMGAALSRGNLTQVAEPKSGGHLGRVIGAGLKAFRSAQGEDRDLVVESVGRALDRQTQREVQSFKRGLGVLATVGSTAPFIGLLGTVMGIVSSFQSMAASGSGGLGTVSAGISEALITTAIGLLVAIPAVMFFNFLQGWVDGRNVDLTESANEFLDVVARQVSAPVQRAG